MSNIHFSVPSTDPEAFSAEWQEWNSAIEASTSPEEPEGEDIDLFDFVRMHEENDVPMDGDAESALASVGFGTDEDYEHYDAWENDM